MQKVLKLISEYLGHPLIDAIVKGSSGLFLLIFIVGIFSNMFLITIITKLTCLYLGLPYLRKLITKFIGNDGSNN